MYYPDELVEEIRSKNDIVDVISGYVRIQKKGSNYMGLCPFHNEKSPSFSVSGSKQIYHCFGCGAHGDAIGYVAQMFGLSQYDAACKIIEDFGLSVVTNKSVSEEEKKVYRDNCMKKQYAEEIEKRFQEWINETVFQLKECEKLILETREKAFESNTAVIAITNGFAYMLHQETKIGYWLDVLCMGENEEKRQLFLRDGKEVRRIAANVKRIGDEILGRNRLCAG